MQTKKDFVQFSACLLKKSHPTSVQPKREIIILETLFLVCKTLSIWSSHFVVLVKSNGGKQRRITIT